MFKKISILMVFLGTLFGCQNRQPDTSKPNLMNTVSTDSLIYDNDTIAIFKLDSATFFTQKAQGLVPKDTMPYITDFEQVKQMLKGRLTFGGWNDETNKIDSLIDGQMTAFIQFNNGDTLNPNTQEFLWDNWFVAYFPSEDIVLFEGGHSSDFSIDLKNGQVAAEIVGNPMYSFISPAKSYRLNGWFPGQECTDYFIQKKTNDGYTMLTRIPLHIGDVDFLLCNIKDKFWLSDNELYFRNNFFSADKRNGFFKVVIK